MLVEGVILSQDLGQEQVQERCVDQELWRGGRPREIRMDKWGSLSAMMIVIPSFGPSGHGAGRGGHHCEQ